MLLTVKMNPNNLLWCNFDIDVNIQGHQDSDLVRTEIG